MKDKCTAAGSETGPPETKAGTEAGREASWQNKEVIIMLISKGKGKHNDDSSHCLAMAFSDVLVKSINDVSTERSYVVSVLT